ncbi:hypothetical protein L2E82_44822 [Cichorium intybus]|uniref:Uncharacterized protein n=1 Tax=Cichorium intybus TaxID=13427 RepID=A0ACB8ZRU8_CICIN|nr:hypothetical protein L2E82_44822 [Cichorium intybus]
MTRNINIEGRIELGGSKLPPSTREKSSGDGNRATAGEPASHSTQENRAAGWHFACRGIEEQPDAQGLIWEYACCGLIWEYACCGLLLSASREMIGQIPLYKMAFRRNHHFLQFLDDLESLVKLMANQDDVVYAELLLEFLSTVRYAPASAEARSRLVRFRLGGSLGSAVFGSLGDGQQPAWDANAVIWAKLSNVFFEVGSDRESQLQEGGEKVSGEDMTYMWVLLDTTRFLHLPYALAISLSTRAVGASASSPLTGGHYITHLARSYRLLTAATMDSLTAIPPIRTSVRALENMHLIHQPQPRRYMRVATEAPRAPRPAYKEELPRRRQRVVPPVPPTHPHQEEMTAL